MQGVRFSNTMPKPADFKRFLALRQAGVAYDWHDKGEFHRLGHKILFALAQELGLKKGEYDLRHCEGGIAVSGEIILHTDTHYVQLSDCDLGMMWRKVKSRKDYTGAQNIWVPWSVLPDLKQIAGQMKQTAAFQILYVDLR